MANNLDLALNLKFNNTLNAELERLKSKFAEVNGKLQSGFAKTGEAVQSLRAKVNSFTAEFQKNWASMIAKTYLLIKAYRLLEDSAKFKQQQDAFRRLAKNAGANGDELIKKLRDMAGETLSTADTIQIASKAIALGLAPENLPGLMEIARKSARALGQDVSYMFNSLAEGIGKQQKLILDNTGIVFQAQTAYEEYAKSIGKTTAQLTDSEKKQAFLLKTISEGNKVYQAINTSQKTQIENLQSLSSFWKDLQIKIGDFLLFSVQGLTLLGNVINIVFFSAFAKIAKVMENMVQASINFVQKMEDVAKTVSFGRAEFDGLINKLEESRAQWALSSDVYRIGTEQLKQTAGELAVLIKGIDTEILDLTDDAEPVKKKFTKVFEKMKEKAEELATTIEEGIGTAFADMIVDGKSFADSMKQLFKDLVKSIIAELTKLVVHSVFKKVLGLLGFGGLGGIFHGGGAVGEFHNGGAIPRAHNGLAVDEVPIIAQTGEGILSRKGMQALGGESKLNALNNGQSLGGVDSSIVINIYNPKANSKEDIRELAVAMGEEVDRQLRYQRGF